MKKFILIGLILGTLPLAGCFGSDDQTTSQDIEVPAGKTAYETSDFVIIVPQDWEVLSAEDLSISSPKSTQVAIRNNVQDELFTANVSVNKGPLEEGLSSKDFAKETIAQAKANLIEFTDISSEDQTVTVGNSSIDTYILTFSGKGAASDPILVFRQLYVAAGNQTGYTVTAAYLPDEAENVVNNIDQMLKSFSLK